MTRIAAPGPYRRSIPALLLALALLLAGCDRATSRDWSSAAENVPAAPPAGHLVTSEDTGEQIGVSAAVNASRVFTQAYKEISTRLFREVRTVDLLNAGWRGIRDEARRQGFVSVDGLQPFIDAGSSDIDAFTREFTHFLTGPGAGLDATKLAQAGILGMTTSVGDSHTRYLTPQQSAVRDGNDSGYSGIGVVTRLDGGPFPLVGEVYAGSPAEQAGIRPGERIVRVNGADIAGRQQSEISSQIRGEIGTTVDLTVVGLDGEPREITVSRAKITVPVVTVRLQDDEIGYVKVAQFPRKSATVDAAADVDAGLTRLLTAGARAIILDLRGNPGGDPTTSVDIASNFTQDGPIFVSIDRNNRRQVYPANRSRQKVTVPVAVLIDGASASGAEVVASALSEYGAAWLIGTRTCGCLSVGQPLKLDDTSQIVVTVQQALTGKEERSLEGIGLDPDEYIRPSRQPGTDPALERAVEYLKSKLS